MITKKKDGVGKVGDCVDLLNENWANIYFNAAFAVALTMSAVHFAQELSRLFHSERQLNIEQKKSGIVQTNKLHDVHVRGYFSRGLWDVYNLYFILHLFTCACHWLTYGLWKQHDFNEVSTSACYEHEQDIENAILVAAITYSLAALCQVILSANSSNKAEYPSVHVNEGGTWPGLLYDFFTGFVFVHSLVLAGTITYFVVKQLEPGNTCKAGGIVSGVWLVCLPVATTLLMFALYGLTSKANGEIGLWYFAGLVQMLLSIVAAGVLYAEKMTCGENNSVLGSVEDVFCVLAVLAVVGFLLTFCRQNAKGKNHVIDSETSVKRKFVPFRVGTAKVAPLGLNQDTMQTLRLTTDGPDRKVAALSFV
jgi:hypothetical protein